MLCVLIIDIKNYGGSSIAIYAVWNPDLRNGIPHWKPTVMEMVNGKWHLSAILYGVWDV